jgi:exodeoxyribonuclease VII small subunit
MSDEKAPGFETNLEELEQVVRQLESGGLSLEESLKLFERGIVLKESCERALAEAESRVEILIKRGRGVVAEPFPPEK